LTRGEDYGRGGHGFGRPAARGEIDGGDGDGGEFCGDEVGDVTDGGGEVGGGGEFGGNEVGEVTNGDGEVRDSDEVGDGDCGDVGPFVNLDAIGSSGPTAQQATRTRSETALSGGAVARHLSVACGQRGAKGHPTAVASPPAWTDTEAPLANTEAP
jgi:hypothetical protein